MFNKLILGTVQLGLDYGINNQHGKPSRDGAFQILNIANLNGRDVYFVKPEYDLKSIGVDYTKATVDGMGKAYQYGYEEGKKLLDRANFFKPKKIPLMENRKFVKHAMSANHW